MDSLEQLEFDKIQSQIWQLCQSLPAKDIQIKPKFKQPQIERQLKLICQIMSFLDIQTGFDFSALVDVRGFITSKLLFDFRQFYSVYKLCQISNIIVGYWQKQKRDFLGDFEQLEEVIRKIYPLDEIEKRFKEIFTPDGEVKDRASKQLNRIRKQITQLKINAQQILDVRLNKSKESIQEQIITIRGGRYVIPIKSGAKLKGFVHSHSSSGATLFFEPMEVAETNNRLAEAKNNEKAEIQRIFTEFTTQIQSKTFEIKTNFLLLARLDFDFATAHFCRKIGGVSPQISQKPKLEFVRATHPLLLLAKGEDAVPFDILIEKECGVVVVSGPNTGGKTVFLKSIGLLCMMAQSGIPIPCGEGTEIGVFKKFFVDIDDASSISEGLSSFSAHIRRIKHFIDEADESSLVLIDEMGAATDPQQGGALACAILSTLKQKKCKVITTTHLNMVKHFASQKEGFVNCSMDFDQTTFSPIYSLNFGFPGDSYGIKTAQNIGLDKTVIDTAISLMEDKDAQFMSLLTDLGRQKKDIQKREKELETLKKSLQEQKSSFEEAEKRYRAKKETLLKKETRQRLAEFTKIQRKMVERLKELKSIKKETLKRSIADISQQIHKMEEIVAKQKGQKLNKVVVGQEVAVKGFETSGRVVEIRDKKIKIDIDGIVLFTRISNLYETETKKTGSFVDKSTKPKVTNTKRELNIRAKRYDDARLLVEKFIDDAILANVDQVRILHGKGTGVLRKMVSDYLKQIDCKHYHPDESVGGAGVTIVNI